MPPVLIALAAAAGFFAVARGFAKAIDAETRRRAAEEERKRAAADSAAKDLGRLEWDETAGVYRPRPPQAS